MEQEKVSDLQHEIRTVREEMSKEKINNIIYEKEKEALENKVNDMESELDRLKEVNTQLESEINQWKVKCELMESAQQTEDELENKNLHYIEEIETLKQLVDERDEELQMYPCSSNGS